MRNSQSQVQSGSAKRWNAIQAAHVDLGLSRSPQFFADLQTGRNPLRTLRIARTKVF